MKDDRDPAVEQRLGRSVKDCAPLRYARHIGIIADQRAADVGPCVVHADQRSSLLIHRTYVVISEIKTPVFRVHVNGHLYIRNRLPHLFRQFRFISGAGVLEGNINESICSVVVLKSLYIPVLRCVIRHEIAQVVGVAALCGFLALVSHDAEEVIVHGSLAFPPQCDELGVNTVVTGKVLHRKAESKSVDTLCGVGVSDDDT